MGDWLLGVPGSRVQGLLYVCCRRGVRINITNRRVWNVLFCWLSLYLSLCSSGRELSWLGREEKREVEQQ